MELRLNYDDTLIVVNNRFFALEYKSVPQHMYGTYGYVIYVAYIESAGDVQNTHIVHITDEAYEKYDYLLREYIKAVFQELKDSICYAKTQTVCIDADYLSEDLKAIFSKVIKEYDSILETANHDMHDTQNKAEYACATALNKYYTEITTTIAEHIDYLNTQA